MTSPINVNGISQGFQDWVQNDLTAWEGVVRTRIRIPLLVCTYHTLIRQHLLYKVMIILCASSVLFIQGSLKMD